MNNKIIKKFKIGLFHKIFFVIICVTIIPVLVVILLNYNISKSNLGNEVNISNLNLLKQTKEATDGILELIENVYVQVLNNDSINTFLTARNKYYSYKDLKNVGSVIDVIEMYLEGISYINDIFIYNLNNDKLVSSLGLITNLEVIDKKQLLKMAQKSKGTIWLEPGSRGVFTKKCEEIQLVRFIFKNYNELTGFIVIQLKNSEFANFIEEKSIRKSGYIVVVDEKGKVVLNRKKGIKSIKDLGLNASWFQKEEGYRRISIRDRELLVSFVTSKYNNWRYIAVLPSDELDSKLDSFRDITIILCILFIIISVLISLAMTKGIYNPIDLIHSILKGETLDENKKQKLLLRKDEIGQINGEINAIIQRLRSEKNLRTNMDIENKKLKKQQAKNIEKLKNYFLYRIITGYPINEQELISQAKFFNIPYDWNYNIIILNVKNSADDKRAKEDILKLRIMKQFEKILSATGKKVITFYEGNNRILGIIICKSGLLDETAYIKSIKFTCEQLQKTIKRDMGIAVGISIGGCYKGLKSIKKSYEDADMAMRYMLILGSDSIIFKDEVNKSKVLYDIDYNYKKFLSNSIETLNIEETTKIINEFKDYLKRNMIIPTQYIFFYRDIINMLMHYLHEKNHLEKRDLEELNMAFINLETKFENIDEATEWILSFIKNVFTFLKNREKDDSNKIVKEAISIIKDEYYKDLSLQEVAERIGVSAPYLSKIFKSELHKNFKIYITEYKLENAKKLLQNTKLSIKEISQKVGYNNALQFSRMFKKFEHITPGEYRKKILKSDSPD